MWPTLQRPVLKTSGFRVGNFYWTGRPQVEKMWGAEGFFKSVLRESRIQASFTSGKGRPGRERGVWRPQASRHQGGSKKEHEISKSLVPASLTPANLSLVLMLLQIFAKVSSLEHNFSSNCVFEAGAIFLQAMAEMQVRIKIESERVSLSLLHYGRNWAMPYKKNLRETSLVYGSYILLFPSLCN